MYRTTVKGIAVKHRHKGCNCNVQWRSGSGVKGVGIKNRCKMSM